jgi:WD40 repeat protein
MFTGRRRFGAAIALPYRDSKRYSGDMTAKLWQKDGTLIKTLTGHTSAVWGIDFSPDGSLMATSSIDEMIKIWTREGVLLMTLTGHTKSG